MSVGVSKYYSFDSSVWQDKKPQEHGSAFTTLEAIKNKPRTVDFTDKNAQVVAKKIWDGYNSKYCAICRYIDDMLQWVMTTERGKVYHLYQEIMKRSSPVDDKRSTEPDLEPVVTAPITPSEPKVADHLPASPKGDEHCVAPQNQEPPVISRDQADPKNHINQLIFGFEHRKAFQQIQELSAKADRSDCYLELLDSVKGKIERSNNSSDVEFMQEVCETFRNDEGEQSCGTWDFSINTYFGFVAKKWVLLGEYEKALTIIDSANTQADFHALKDAIKSFPPEFYEKAHEGNLNRLFTKPIDLELVVDIYDLYFKEALEKLRQVKPDLAQDYRNLIYNQNKVGDPVLKPLKIE